MLFDSVLGATFENRGDDGKRFRQLREHGVCRRSRAGRHGLDVQSEIEALRAFVRPRSRELNLARIKLTSAVVFFAVLQHLGWRSSMTCSSATAV